MTLKRRHATWLIAASVLVLAGSLVAFAVGRRGPYAFLEKYRPQRIDVDIRALFAKGPEESQASYPKARLLVFEERDHQAIADAMKHELTMQKGFLFHDASYDSPTRGPNDEMFQFALGPEKAGDVLPAGAYFEYGMDAARDLKAVKSNESIFTTHPELATPKSPACIVVIVGEESWLDRQGERLRGFLHL